MRHANAFNIVFGQIPPRATRHLGYNSNYRGQVSSFRHVLDVAVANSYQKVAHGRKINTAERVAFPFLIVLSTNLSLDARSSRSSKTAKQSADEVEVIFN